MAKTLTIAGVNFLPQYVTNSLSIREVIQNKAGVMDIDITVKSGQNTPQEGSEIVMKDGSRFLFGGYVSRIQPQEVGKGSFFKYQVEASDYSYIFSNKIAARAYQGETLKAIVEDLIDSYVGASYGFDTTNVATGPTIETVVFDHIDIRKCFEKLSKLTGYVWYVDYEKNLFFKTQETTPSPETVTDAGTNIENISIAYDTSQIRNSVTVIGADIGEQSLVAIVQTIEGDGNTRTWPLDATPGTIASITLNGVAKSISPVETETETDYFIYSASDLYLQVTPANPTPVGGGTPDEIIITYYPMIDIIAKKQDVASIAFFAALDGGDGIYEFTIKDPAIASKAEAGQRALQELSQYATPLVKGIFKTRTDILSGGSYFKVGQILTINLTTWGIPTDTTFLVQQVDTNIVEDSTGTDVYLYTVRFGGKLVGVGEFLEALAAQFEEVSESTEIKTIRSLVETIEMEDGNLSHAILTPPFKYGPTGGTVGKWNLSEWQ